MPLLQSCIITVCEIIGKLLEGGINASIGKEKRKTLLRCPEHTSAGTGSFHRASVPAHPMVRIKLPLALGWIAFAARLGRFG